MGIHSFMFVAFLRFLGGFSRNLFFLTFPFYSPILLRSHLYSNTMYVPALYHTSSAHHIFSIFHGAQQPFFCPSKKIHLSWGSAAIFLSLKKFTDRAIAALRYAMELVPSTWNPLRAPPCAASAPSRPGRGAGGHGLPLRGWGLGVSVSAVALQRQSRRSRDARAARNAEKAEKKSLGSCTFEVFSMILRK